MLKRHLKRAFAAKKQDPAEESFFRLWREAAAQYAAAAMLFSDAADPALVEAAIFDMKAAEARRSFALRQLRALDSAAQPRGLLRTHEQP